MSKLELTSQERSALRAAAHPLHPIVLIGDRGLTESVLSEIDRSLDAHELIKVRVSGAEREAREAMLATICETLSCAAVHHLGKTLIIYRPDLIAQQTRTDARNATRALRKPSEPYISKKQAAQSRDPKPRDPKPQKSGSSASQTRRSAARSAPTHTIPRRSSGAGSALSLRAGRRGRTTRS
ncbi:YhbY family RNA-binding protein [Alcaligenaceae bacterium CGII-47]|nr:YhbY family RNA-binding protein [Alcaligenaceae bacterium CGII-47]